MQERLQRASDFIRSLTPEQLFVCAQLARHDFYFFNRFMLAANRDLWWLKGPHHKLICDALTEVFEEEEKRVIINIPPRYSKTELAVIGFTAWTIGHYPDSEYIHSSYTAGIAEKNSAEIKKLISNPFYNAIFPGIEFDMKRKRGVDEWYTTAGGCFQAMGQEGEITGKGAGKRRPGFGGAIIIDDPHKANDIRYENSRKGAIYAFQNTLERRLNVPDRTPIILIMQRLHEEDLAGWLINGGNGEKWKLINLPALAGENDLLGRVPGECLWSDMHTREALLKLEDTEPWMFAGQYMQRPTPMEGGLFKPDRMVAIDAIEPGSKLIRAWDFAGSKDGDWTVGALLARQPSGRIAIIDIVRFRDDPSIVEKTLIATAHKDGKAVKIYIPQDPAQAGKFQVSYFARQLAGFIVKSTPQGGDKITRAEPFASQMNLGNVDVMAGTEWLPSLISELRNFPNSKNDDQVDALAQGFMNIFQTRVPIQISPDALSLSRMPMRGSMLL